MILTRDNYHSQEANIPYMSVSQYKDFTTCEAAALAKLMGDYVPPVSDAFLLGSYVHAWNEGTLDDFKTAHPEMYTKTGKLYEKFKSAPAIIDTLTNDPFCMHVLSYLSAK